MSFLVASEVERLFLHPLVTDHVESSPNGSSGADLRRLGRGTRPAKSGGKRKNRINLDQDASGEESGERRA